jgi:hypothetical protein
VRLMESKIKLSVVDEPKMNTDYLYHVIETEILPQQKQLELLEVHVFKGPFRDVDIYVYYDKTHMIDITINIDAVFLWANVGFLLKTPPQVKMNIIEFLEKIAALLPSPYKDTIEIVVEWLTQKVRAQLTPPQLSTTKPQLKPLDKTPHIEKVFTA